MDPQDPLKVPPCSDRAHKIPKGRQMTSNFGSYSTKTRRQSGTHRRGADDLAQSQLLTRMLACLGFYGRCRINIHRIVRLTVRLFRVSRLSELHARDECCDGCDRKHGRKANVQEGHRSWRMGWSRSTCRIDDFLCIESLWKRER